MSWIIVLTSPPPVTTPDVRRELIFDIVYRSEKICTLGPGLENYKEQKIRQIMKPKVNFVY